MASQVDDRNAAALILLVRRGLVAEPSPVISPTPVIDVVVLSLIISSSSAPACARSH